MNRRLIHIIVLSLSLLFIIQCCFYVEFLQKQDVAKKSNISKIATVVSATQKIYGYKDILALSEENKNVKITKIGVNLEDKTKVNVEIEYNGDKDSFNDILKSLNLKENIYAINNISISNIDKFAIKGLINIDFIKNK